MYATRFMHLRRARLSNYGPCPAMREAFHAVYLRFGRASVVCGMCIALMFGVLLVSAKPVAAQSYQIFVPSISTQGVSGVGEEPPAESCLLNAQEAAVAELMENDANQRRKNPVCDATLSMVARARARDMAQRGYFSHTNPDGDGPNILVTRAGYVLPDWYSDGQSANNIESIGGGYVTADSVWQGWLDSQYHRMHVLGTEDFYAEQLAYGVGYYHDPNSRMKHYWVFLSAPLAE